MVRLKKNNLILGSNLRVPCIKSREAYKQKIRNKLKAYQKKSSLTFSSNIRIWRCSCRKPNVKWIKILVNIFGDVTGIESKAKASGGVTTARKLPNAVCFGPLFPGERYTGHTVNEFKKVENLYLDLQMITEVILRMGNYDGGKDY